MEFWGVEVKHGEPIEVSPGEGMVLHLSQANVGELKKGNGNETVRLLVTVDGKKLVLGTLYTENLPHQLFDIVFEKDFELSHDWKNGSVFFIGYKARNSVEEDSDNTVASTDRESGKHESKAKEQKPAKEKKSDAGNQKPLPNELLSETESSDDDSKDDDEPNTEDEDDSDAESDESEEETPTKAETSKKRQIEPASKTPVAQKKAKVTPHSTDGKKGSVHVDTPYPSRPAGNKGPFAEKKVNPHTPKSGGSHLCTMCNKIFGTDKAVESHSKAKHAGGK